MSAFRIVILAALATVSSAVFAAEQSTVTRSLSNQDGAANRSPHELRQEMHAALRSEATSKGTLHEASVRRLVAVFEELAADTQLPDHDRRELLAVVRNRLARVSDKLQQDLERKARIAPASVKLPAKAAAVLDQQRAVQPGRAVQVQQSQPASELIDLIQRTIAPGTWDVNGGIGTAIYYSPSQVLVVRATEDVHEQLSDLLWQLRQ